MMRRLLSLICVATVLALGAWLLGRDGELTPETTTRRQVMSRMMAQPGGTGGNNPAALTVAQIGPVAPVVVRLGDLPRGATGPGMYQRWLSGQIDLEEQHELFSDADRARALAAALAMPADGDVQRIPWRGASLPIFGFDSLDFGESTGAVPPDPILAVGRTHVIAAVNVVFQVYDKAGNNASGIVAFSTFFQNIPQCVAGIGPFDPVALYDEEADRYIVGVDGNGTHFCLAVTASGDPTGTWQQYAFATGGGNIFFDYPQAGVGHNAIYVGSNQFNGLTFQEGRLWAFDKWAMYAGQAAASATASTGHTTPQPMHLHGDIQQTWPTSGPHYFLTHQFDLQHPDNHILYAWNDPFGINQLIQVATINLTAITGVPASQPIPAPQLGSSDRIQANDVRQLDLEYRNGRLWTAMTIGCNPGSGVVNCIRWAELNPAAPPSQVVVQAGVFGSNGQHRLFPDLAVDAFGDVVIGYTKTSAGMYPAMWAACRRANTPANEMELERQLKAGEASYDSFESPPYRWGDYTEMTIDPDGLAFWYLGQYSKDIDNQANWGTYVSRFDYFTCAGIEVDPSAYVPIVVDQ